MDDYLTLTTLRLGLVQTQARWLSNTAKQLLLRSKNGKTPQAAYLGTLLSESRSITRLIEAIQRAAPEPERPHPPHLHKLANRSAPPTSQATADGDGRTARPRPESDGPAPR